MSDPLDYLHRISTALTESDEGEGSITDALKLVQRELSIKVDADSRNIEELEVEPDPEKFSPRKSEEEMKALESGGYAFKDYEGMMKEMENGTLVIDDISEYETEKLIEIYRPDVFCAGIKEKYGIQKHGVPSKQLHSYDYGGPYAGFEGAINFWREIDRMVNATVWTRLDAPWTKKAKPTLDAAYVRS